MLLFDSVRWQAAQCHVFVLGAGAAADILPGAFGVVVVVGGECAGRGGGMDAVLWLGSFFLSSSSN
jgi:hypothetical protein